MEALYILPIWGTLSHGSLGQIALAAVQQDIKINEFWLGRYPWKSINQTIDEKILAAKTGNVKAGDLLLINYAPILIGLIPDDETAAYVADDVLLLGGKDLGSVAPDLKRASIETLTLNDYVDRLKSAPSDRLTVVTARQTYLATNVEAQTLDPLMTLGLDQFPAGDAEFLYGAIIRDGDVLSQQTATTPLNISFEDRSISNSDLPSTDVAIILDPVRSQFPIVTIGGRNASRALSGVNIAVYDRQKREIIEVGAFPGFGVTPGILLRIDPKPGL